MVAKCPIESIMPDSIDKNMKTILVRTLQLKAEHRISAEKLAELVWQIEAEPT